MSRVFLVPWGVLYLSSNFLFNGKEGIPALVMANRDMCHLGHPSPLRWSDYSTSYLSVRFLRDMFCTSVNLKLGWRAFKGQNYRPWTVVRFCHLFLYVPPMNNCRPLPCHCLADYQCHTSDSCLTVKLA